MSAVAAAIAGSAVIGGIAVYLASESESEAADKAIASQEKMSTESLALQKVLADQSRADVEPWRAAGERALTDIQKGIDTGAFEVSDREPFDASQVDVTQDPGYDFRMSQGVDALDASASARGRLLSGAQREALTGYGQEMGSQEYGNAYARARSEYDDEYARETQEKARKFNILSSMAGTGQIASGQQVGINRNLANQSTNIMGNQGRAVAQGEYAKGQARAGAYQGGAQTVNQAAQNWLYYKELGKKNPIGTIAPQIGNA
jgi:hypothetical protein